MPSTLTTFDAFLKEKYNDQKVEDMAKCGRPFFSELNKDEDGSGDVLVVPFITRHAQGVAADARATAQGVNSSGANVGGDKWQINWGKYFGSVYIGDQVMRASRNNTGAFLQNQETEVDGLYETHFGSLATYAVRNGGGAIGRRASASTNVITLTEPADVFNFEIGMGIVASAADGSSSSDALRAGSTYVTAIDPENGTITLNSAAAITSFADNDYLARQGDFAGTTGTIHIKGIEAFVTPSSTPATLWNITNTTRATNPQRYAGCRIVTADLSGKGIEERIQLLGAYMAGRYRTMDGNYRVMLHPEDWHRLQLSLQARGQRSLKDDSTRFGFQYVEVVAGGRSMRCYADPYFIKGTAFMLRMENWKITSLGKLVGPLNGDGLQMLRASTTDDYELRLISYPGMSCNAMGWQGRVPV